MSLFSDLEKLRENPYSRADLCLRIQETLICRIRYVERQIRSHKAIVQLATRTRIGQE